MSKNKERVEVEKTQPIAEEPTQTLVEATAEAKKTTKPEQKGKEKSKDNKKTNKKSAKEKGKLKRKARESMSELKKVTWPSFGEVCKRTGVVLVVVLVFAIVIFGIDYGLGALTSLLKK